MKKSHKFILGKRYSRREIHEKIGGEEQTYLPQKHGRIVCGCFKMGGNPNAPREILPGNVPIVMKKATIFCHQIDPVPVFIKRATNKWEYIGDYVAESCDDSPALLKRKEKEASRNNLGMVIYLKRV